MRKIAVLFALLLLSLAARAQETHSPQATITSIFAAMKAADTTGLRAYFHPSATLHSVVTKPDGSTVVSEGSITRWFKGIKGAAAGALDEQLHYTEVRTDGHLSTAWTPYVFMYQGAMHHCGVNAFQLVKDGADGRWRVLHITDTRRDGAGDCEAVSDQSPHDAIDALATRWHLAAAQADSATFFDAMEDDGIYIGTDKGEHWTKEEFLGFAAPYFARGKAWDFNATERHVFYDPANQVAYWDELLHTWMGPCRGTAVVRRSGPNGWKIAHYTLSVTVPNDKIQGFIELTGERRKER
ncbi:nuclear transport factor 2 family protein [Neolewinella lacunae]|uniref:Nuclear transport factor 2 family protein n=1 Tax=Neolewinella lacunae TaxID=1517758 RepID=A0A923PRU0_9BACT|nr:nuclear transport factor 2 family protein [Neolewinella lacunae]MBC6995587.1 nuclear transport factor 2 family protein [Neolewinella lacunae]MDN3635623.1 nuclear transport factor 2 family protein [Neolewinella lacunae]